MATTVELEPIPGEKGPHSQDLHVPRLPGVRLFDSGEREYPLESIEDRFQLRLIGLLRTGADVGFVVHPVSCVGTEGDLAAGEASV